jgi:demethylmenaquinone methyltransferase/2-methoxy-6-polyprenyl-1,4-benzoquinol methylase
MSNGDVFSDIAARYDRINRLLSLGRDQAWRQRVVAHLPVGRRLDLGGGTGAANPILGPDPVALDPAPEMLGLNPAAHRVVGVGEALPFAGGSFDAVFSAYVFRNLDSIDTTLAEVARVLRPGGKAGIVDLGRPEVGWQRALHRAGSAVVLPTVGAATGAREEYTYLHHSLDSLPQPQELYADGPMEIEDLWRMGPFGFVYGVILAKPQ